MKAKRSLCEDCYDEELTREHNAQLPPRSPVSPVVPVPRAANEDNTYAMAWTDGGRRDVFIRKQKLSNVGGWAYLLLCGRGEKYVSSSSLGPDSTNNIAEFTAILEVVQHAVSLRITQLDIKTDCKLVTQYHDNVVIKDSEVLAQLYEGIAGIARSAGLQFRLQHVEAHKHDMNNNLVDSMCTAVILANDMETRTQGPTHISQFHNPDNCTLPRSGPNPAVNYRTFAPYAPLYEDVTPS